jgi:hypothetical protein
LTHASNKKGSKEMSKLRIRFDNNRNHGSFYYPIENAIVISARKGTSKCMPPNPINWTPIIVWHTLIHELGHWIIQKLPSAFNANHPYYDFICDEPDWTYKQKFHQLLDYPFDGFCRRDCYFMIKHANSKKRGMGYYG